MRLFIRLVVTSLLFTGHGAAVANTSDRSAADIAALYGPVTEYAIYRNGERIGRHTLKFDKQGDNLTVNVESSLTVRVLKIPVFKFRYAATEQWEGNQLVAASAVTSQNGKTKKVSLDTYHARSETFFSSNHWHAGVLSADQVFNTITGDVSRISLRRMGEEPISVGDRSIEATRYRYSDEIEADVWYDKAGLWAQLAFRGDDGSEIVYVRQ